MTYVALLRAVNVGGHQPVAMAKLTGMLAQLGISDVRTVLQSGNLVMRIQSRGSAGAIELMLEKECRERLGLVTDFFVRSAAQWKAVVADNPFAAEAERDPGHLVVTFTKDLVKPAGAQALQEFITGPERIHARDRHLYITYPAGIGGSRLTNSVIERKLGTRATARNWKTVLRLAAIVQGG